MKEANRNKKFLLLTLILLILVVAVGNTIAFLLDVTGEVENIFEPTEVTCTIEESFINNVKNDVRITNTSDDVEAYIRAAVVVTWQNAEGHVYPQMPVAGKDYQINWGMDGLKKQEFTITKTR